MEKFSQTVKEEIMRGELGRWLHCQQAELAAIIHIAGSIHIAGQGKLSLSISTESAAVARRTVKLLKAAFNLESEIRVEVLERLGKLHRYNILLAPQKGLYNLLYGLGVITPEHMLETDIHPSLVKKECCRAAFLKGSFLAGGSITDPQKKTYHLELVAHNEAHANSLAYLMNLAGVKAKISKRKESYIVYLKDSGAIARFLSIVGAHTAVIKLEEVKVIKGLRGNVNRLVNCETANLGKSVSAAMEQVEMITALLQSPKAASLPEKLRDTAAIRLAHPEVNLKELGELHLPPISKSAVNHRLRLIREYCKELT